MKLKNESILRFGILFILLAGVLWTAINVLRADALSKRMHGKLAVIQQLREMKQQQDLIETSFAALASVSNAAPSLSALASAAATGSAAEIRELDSRVLGHGWNVKRTEVVFKEVSLNSVADFLRSAETQRPPWRLAECVIAASSKADGCGAAALTMETVVRQP